ncbi:MAG TPA: hypothetical protein VEC57_15830 [Candidatus Limnocylindrales bacterium]|nr:hypothetical protein [Candidatus Limnocylindrales bacterium]
MRISPAFIMGLALVVSASPAHALDVEGTWQGKQVCKLFNSSGLKDVDKFDAAMEISQEGTVVAVDIDDGTWTYSGAVLQSAQDADSGEIGMTLCKEGQSETVRLKVKGDKMQGISIFRTNSENDTCKWVFERVSTEDPLVTPCP